MPFGISFTNPLALLLWVPLAAYFFWLAHHSLADLSPWRRRTATGIRLLILSLLVLALAGLQIVSFNRSIATMFVLDTSDSIAPQTKEAALKFIQDATKTKKDSDKVGLIVFGREAYIELAPDTARAIGQIRTVTPTEFTDLAAAIRLGIASLPDGMQKRLVVLSDGNENLGDALDESLSAASNNVRIDVVPLASPQRREILLEKLMVPSEAKIGEPVEITVIARSTSLANAKIGIYRDKKLIATRSVRLQNGKNVLRFPQAIRESGAATFEARLETGSGADTNAENNRALGFVNIQGRPRILMVSDSPDLSHHLVAALQREKVNIELRGPGGLPADLRAMQPFDAIILDNIPAYSLTATQMVSLQSYVRDLGCGLVMVGGENSFGPGGYRETPVEEALPVTMDIKQMQYIPGGALAMVMHSCEFPGANEWSKSICAQAVRQLGDQDYAGVVVYGMDADWAFKDSNGSGMMKVAPNRNFMLAEVRKLNPGDMPDFDAALEVAYNGLIRTKAHLKHAIILSDGDPSPPAPALVKKFNDAKITVSTIVIQPHDGSGDQSMFNIAKQHGGRFYKVNKPSEIPNIFLKEAATISRSAIIEEVFVPRYEAQSQIMKGIGGWPPLLGYVGTTAKPTAREVLASRQDDPILATWQYGLGKSVAFTSDARNRWGAGWLPWSGYSKFWAQAVRWSMRASPSSDWQTNVQIDRGRGKVTIEAVDERGHFLNFLSPKARLITPDFRFKDLLIDQTGPGRYEANFDARQLGTYLINIRSTRANQTRSQVTGGVLAYSPEYGAVGTNEFLLNGIASRTGGQILSFNESARVFGRARVASRWPMEIGLSLLMIAACLFPLDVAVRRLLIGEEELEKRVAQWRNRVQRNRIPSQKPPPHARVWREKIKTQSQPSTSTKKSPPSSSGLLASDTPESDVSKPPTEFSSSLESQTETRNEPQEMNAMERLRQAKRRARGE